MEVLKNKLNKALEKCKSMKSSPLHRHRLVLRKSKSLPLDLAAAHVGTPQGCFAVYVGPERKRFVVRVEQLGHPMFRSLLEDAEAEYGHRTHGPLLLPCDVELFCDVLAHMSNADRTTEFRPRSGGGVAMRAPSLALPFQRAQPCV